jgi:hypothetical protein
MALSLFDYIARKKRSDGGEERTASWVLTGKDAVAITSCSRLDHAPDDC